MNSFDISILSNGIKVITRKNNNTPRTAVNLFINSGIKCETKAGEASLSGRLLLQGTDTRNAEEIAKELDNNAIEMSVDTKQDYTKVRTVFLNEDFDKAINILADATQNSTFEKAEKESVKLKGEIEMDLDSPRTKAIDNLIKNIYPDHPYGNTHTKILNDLPEINMDLLKEFYYSALMPDAMTFAVVGDIDKDSIINTFESKFGSIKKDSNKCTVKIPDAIRENKTVLIKKADAAQAQIVKGWIVPDIASEDFAPLAIFNTILGASGLSSRLFVELRDKKGLAYHVRSTFEPFKHSGTFSVYIGTAPVNINIALEGFNTEIKKLQEELVSKKELEDARSNYLGKRAFYHETNAQQAHYLGYYDIIGLGADYDNIVPEKIKKVSEKDIREVANKYLSSNSVISILAPEEYLGNF
ncbi:MAG: pitrilysin family protein [Candidatus Gastranaerophilales bacterium]|nr:pitrilysin family protein [Candidatus Gastranaerophilales bacterium]